LYMSLTRQRRGLTIS